MSKQTIRLAHSPDADDFFMFWALREKLIASPEFEFQFESYDTQTLNTLAQNLTYDVLAVSLACYPKLASHYAILSHGASVGRGYGPVVVSREILKPADLNKKTVAVPGLDTTSCQILRKLFPKAKLVEVSISPYERIFNELETGRVDAALLIHEGQLTYKKRGLHKVLDIGVCWQEEKNLPLPLGINVIRLGLGSATLSRLSSLIQSSIRYALDNKQSLISELLKESQERGVEISDPDEISGYLQMYANEDSYSMSEDCKLAIREILGAEVELNFA